MKFYEVTRKCLITGDVQIVRLWAVTHGAALKAAHKEFKPAGKRRHTTPSAYSVALVRNPYK
jgi:hypothetical protein